MAGDPRLAAMALIDTEQPHGQSWRFRSFVGLRHLPGMEATLGWIAGNRAVRRQRLVFGDCFVDRALLDGEFDEFFLAPLRTSPDHRRAAVELLRSFEPRLLRELDALHRRIDVPVQLVWGRRDPFFPVAWAEEMVATFTDARLAVVEQASLFSHEERPAEVAAAMLPVLTGTR